MYLDIEASLACIELRLLICAVGGPLGKRAVNGEIRLYGASGRPAKKSIGLLHRPGHPHRAELLRRRQVTGRDGLSGYEPPR